MARLTIVLRVRQRVKRWLQGDVYPHSAGRLTGAATAGREPVRKAVGIHRTCHRKSLFYNDMSQIIEPLNGGFMKQKEDSFTRDIDGMPKRRGRPASPDTPTAAERKAAHRQKLAEEGKGEISLILSLDVIDALGKHVQFKDEGKGEAADRILRAYLLRKR